MNQLSQLSELSVNFSKILNEWLTQEEITSINQLNSTQEYLESDSCASHEFCDSNQAMVEAFEKVYNREPDTRIDSDVEIINQAWAISKQNQFKI